MIRSDMATNTSASRRTILRRGCCIAAASFLMLLPAAAWALDLDDNFQITSLDIPVINVSLSTNGVDALVSHDGVDPNDPFKKVDTITFQAFYDTGTSGILLSKEIADDFNIHKIQSGGNDVIFSDIAVGGTFQTNVSPQLYVRLAPNNPTVDPQTNPSIDPDIAANYTQFGPFNVQISTANVPEGTDPQNIEGTPAMQGKVVLIDSTAINRATKQLLTNDPNANLDDLALRTFVYNPGQAFVGGEVNPGIPPANFHVKLSSADFSRFTSVSPSGAPGPALAANPFIGPNPTLPAGSDTTPKLKISYQGHTAEGSFLLDSGAQFTMISNAMAQQLQITHTDPNDPSSALEIGGQPIVDQFSSTVGGADGTPVTRPGFFLDSILVHTLEATSGLDTDPNNLNFLHVPVLVSDITSHDPVTGDDLTLDGVFGMNLLTAGADLNSLVEYLFGLIDSSELQANASAFDYVAFNQADGTLDLTLAGSAVPEPSTAALAGLGMMIAAAILARRKRD